MVCLFEPLDKAISVAHDHYKKHERKTSFCDARKEHRNDEEYFALIGEQDVIIEEGLNRKLKILIDKHSSDSTQRTGKEIKLFLLYLSGHISKLEYRRALFTILAAALLVTIPILETIENPFDSLFILLTSLFVLAFWVTMKNIEERIFVLKRTLEHLKSLTEQG